MSYSEYLRHPIETIRSAPYGAALCASSILPSVLEVMYADAESLPAKVVVAGAVAINSLGGVLAAYPIVRRQLTLKSRLEESLDESGFNERIMAKTTDEWCNRQTARVVNENNGTLEQYQQLCNARHDTARLAWLPHI